MTLGKTAGSMVNAPTGKPLSLVEVQDSIDRSRPALIALGEITAVLMQRREFRKMTLPMLEAVATPAITHKQFMILTAHSEPPQASAPVAVILWAMVSPEIDRRLMQSRDSKDALRSNEWKTGDIPWIMVLAGNESGTAMLLDKARRGQFAGKTAKMYAWEAKDKVTVRTFPPL
jgi:hemolysin-activating ACP:hemolysin acyltransferase